MEIPLPLPQFLIGRDAKCNLRPSSEAVSKLHCAILQKPDGVFVRDLKSTNGTFVNNDRISAEVKVNDGDLVRVGPLVLAVKIQAEAGKTDQPSPSSDEEQAVSWLLDYSPGGVKVSEDFGTKTTIMEGASATKPAGAGKDEKEPEKEPAAAAASDAKKPEPSRSKNPTAELAGDILNKLLAPPRKKRS